MTRKYTNSLIVESKLFQTCQHNKIQVLKAIKHMSTTREQTSHTIMYKCISFVSRPKKTPNSKHRREKSLHQSTTCKIKKKQHFISHTEINKHLTWWWILEITYNLIGYPKYKKQYYYHSHNTAFLHCWHCWVILVYRHKMLLTYLSQPGFASMFLFYNTFPKVSFRFYVKPILHQFWTLEMLHSVN